MRRLVRLVAVPAAVMAVALVACGPSKPTGAEYLGKWEAVSVDHSGEFGRQPCRLNISRNGESFIMTVENRDGVICAEFDGLFTLTPEGNLKGGPLEQMTLSYDKGTNRIALSYGGVQYLKKR